MCVNTTPLRELRGGPDPITEPFCKAQSCRTLALLHVPCIHQDQTCPVAPNTPLPAGPHPTTGSFTPGQGRTNATQASSFFADKALLASARGSPHPNPISLSANVMLKAFTGWVCESCMGHLGRWPSGRPGGDRPAWHSSPLTAGWPLISLPHGQGEVPILGQNHRFHGVFWLFFFLSKKMVVSWALGTGATAAPLETPRSSACSSHPTTLTSPQAYRLGRQEE